MLKVFESLDCHVLLDSFIKEFSDNKNWENPFNSPIVIFSDNKLEQWFKLHWIEKRVKNQPILMNLKTQKINDFLFSAVASGIENDSHYSQLTASILRDYLLKKLVETKDGIPFYRRLESRDVDKYIERKDSSINEINLYDFAETASRLFIEYENTRGEEFCSQWKKGNNYFSLDNKDLADTEKWQRKLYCEIFNPSIRIKSEGGNADREYVTLLQLAQKNKEANGGKLKFPEIDVPVYIFGFTAIDQTTIELIKEFAAAQKINVNVFIQGTSTDEKEVKNVFLKKWGTVSSETLQLFEENIAAGQIEKLEGNKECDSLLKTIQAQILKNENSNDVFEKYLTDNKSLSLISAPSKIREIEAVHSRICSIINEQQKKGEPVTYSDFAVYAPKIQDYKVSVMQVFDQADKNSSKGFPHVPYIIADYSAESSLTTEALQIFLRIVKNNSLSRNDFFSIVRNPVVQWARNIHPDDIYIWGSWVTQLNCYRDRETNSNDWSNAAARLLLSKLTKSTVVLDEENQYLPFSDLNCEDNNLLYSFVDCVDELESLREKFHAKQELDSDDLDELKAFVERWLRLPADCPAELSGERIVFNNIIAEINLQYQFTENSKSKINAATFFIALCENAAASHGSSSGMFTGGITFASLKPNRIIPQKYIFMLGLDSKVFPGVDRRNGLDLRINNERHAGDLIQSLQNKNIFLCQMMAAEKLLYLSYVNKDLQKDENFFCSSVISDLMNEIFPEKDNGQLFEQKIMIDENRKWSELFTQRECRNKHNYEAITKKDLSQEDDSNGEFKTGELPDRVTVSNLKDYLSDPFVFKIHNLFSDSRSEDESIEEIAEFEPLSIAGFERRQLLNELIKSKLNFSEALSFNRQTLRNRNILPDDCFGDFEFEKLEKESDDVAGLIQNEFDINALPFVYDKKINQTIEYTDSSSGDEKNWQLTGNISWHFWNENSLTVITLAAGQKLSARTYLSGYVSALALIAESETPEKIEVKLVVINNKINSNSFSIDKEEALTILNEIYEKAFNEKKYPCVPVDLLNDQKIKNEDDIISELHGMHGIWQFFEKGNLFSDDFIKKNLLKSWQKNFLKQKQLIKYLIDENPAEGAVEND